MKYSQIEQILKTRYSEFKYAEDIEICQLNEGIFATRKGWLKDTPNKSIFYAKMLSDGSWLECDKDNMIVNGIEIGVCDVFTPSQEDLEADDWMYAVVKNKKSEIFKEL